MKKLLFISDFFSNQIVGGTEKNDNVLINYLKQHFDLAYINCKKLTENIVNAHDLIVVSNFMQLSDGMKELISTKKYIIYEHDHKYVNTRDPSVFSNFIIPKEKIVNKFFYKRAYKVVTLSKICQKILIENLNLNNVINIGTSLWSNDDLNKIEEIFHKEDNTTHKISILKSGNPIKGFSDSIKICEKNNLKPNIIKTTKQEEIWKQLSQSETFLFVPKVLETFSRITCEAKMLGCKVMTKKSKIGFLSEELQLDGKELISEIRRRVDIAKETFLHILLELSEDKKVICFIGKFDEIYDEEGKARALEETGYRVLRFEERKLLNKELVLKANPDFLFYTKLRIKEKEKLLNQCKEKNITTVCWVPDLYFGLERENELSSNPIFKSDYVLTPDGGNEENFKKLNINHHCIRQGISKEYLSKDIEEKDIDILFVGTLQKCHLPYRKNLLDFLKKTYSNKFQWFGNTGDRELRNDSLAKVYKRSKIVIGECVESDNYWSNRIYEALGRNSFLIHPHVKGIEKEFNVEKELITYERNNFEDLKNKIDYYLENEKERNFISSNGYKKVSENDLLLNRSNAIKELLS